MKSVEENDYPGAVESSGALRIDRRVQRTQSALRQALVDLILEKDYQAITVEEITQRANVSRATFYLHFQDKDDLLMGIFRELVAGRMALFWEIPLNMLDEGAPPNADAIAGRWPIIAIFQHAAENAPLYRLALKEDRAGRLAADLRLLTVQALEDLLSNKVKQAGPALKLQVPLDLLAQAFVSAFLACLSWWLENDMPCPPHEIARLFRLMFFPGVRAAFGMTGLE